MSDDPLKPYSYYGQKEQERFPGTEDWVTVAELGNGGFEWEEFKVFYSPSERRYFWRGDSGCSCNDWKEGVSSKDDFQNGDREAVLRSWEEFTKEYSYVFDVNDYLKGVSEIRKFNV